MMRALVLTYETRQRFSVPVQDWQEHGVAGTVDARAVEECMRALVGIPHLIPGSIRFELVDEHGERVE